MLRILALLTTLLPFAAPAEELPKVLLLGDSISIGYTPHVQRILAEDAEVIRPMKDAKKPENCAYSAFGLTRLDAWLGDTKWAVIHFNFGLHDMKYIGQPLPNAKIVGDRGEAIRKNPDARQLSSLENYLANLEKIVERLRKTEATLIFCATTPIPEGSRGRLPGDEVRFNNAAKELMKKLGVEVNDLHAYASTPKVLAQQRKADVHYTPAGSKLLGQKVATTIRSALKK